MWIVGVLKTRNFNISQYVVINWDIPIVGVFIINNINVCYLIKLSLPFLRYLAISAHFWTILEFFLQSRMFFLNSWMHESSLGIIFFQQDFSTAGTRNKFERVSKIIVVASTTFDSTSELTEMQKLSVSARTQQLSVRCYSTSLSRIFVRIAKVREKYVQNKIFFTSFLY